MDIKSYQASKNYTDKEVKTVMDSIDAQLADIEQKVDVDIPAQLADIDQRIDTIIATPIDLPEIYVDEIHDARQGKGSIGANITEVKSQLAQTEEQISSIESANSNEMLRIENYLGNFQNIHPKVLYFPNGWNGFKYWLAYSPYPVGQTEHENPCIAVSNDMIKWTVPNGLTNPLDFGTVINYNSDPHLVYRQDTNVLEIWWRRRVSEENNFIIYRRTSTDGVNWSDKELVVPEDMMSMSVIYEDGRYKMWYIRQGFVRYRESLGDTIASWTDPQPLPIDWTSQSLTPWHLDVLKTDLGYEMIVTAYKPGGSNNTTDLYHVVQVNATTFTKPKLVLAKSKNPLAIDNRAIYRSSFIKVEGVYYLFYSCIDAQHRRWMALSYGSNIAGLNGLKYLRNGERVLEISEGGTIEEISVANYDTILVTTSDEVTINLIKGGYYGKKINIVLGNLQAKVILPFRNMYLETPHRQDFVLSAEIGVQSVDLVSYHSSTWGWKVVGYQPPLPKSNKYVVSAGETLTDFDVTDIDRLEIAGGNITINSFVGGYAGKVIHIYCTSEASSATFVHSSRMNMPGTANYTLNPTKMGLTAVLAKPNTNQWRLF